MDCFKPEDGKNILPETSVTNNKPSLSSSLKREALKQGLFPKLPTCIQILNF